jgi:hypothetical protein
MGKALSLQAEGIFLKTIPTKAIPHIIPNIVQPKVPLNAIRVSGV